MKPFMTAQRHQTGLFPAGRRLPPAAARRRTDDRPAAFSRRFRHDFSRVPALAIQARLHLHAPDDKYEQEADRVAQRVMRMPASWGGCPTGRSTDEEQEPVARMTPPAARITPLVQRQAVEEEEEEAIQRQEEEEEEELQARTAGGPLPGRANPHLEAQLRNLRDGGRRLPGPSRRFFEDRFGHDFSRVKVHSDARSARLARMINARAFTVGNQIHFNRGCYRPNQPEGMRLLAHELTHVVQQARMRSQTAPQRIQCRQARPLPPVSANAIDALSTLPMTGSVSEPEACRN
jgi:hypothetical protein